MHNNSAGGVSPSDLAQIIRNLTSFKEQVEICLRETHPELLRND